MAGDVTIEGIDELIRQLTKLGDDIASKTEPAIDDCADLIAKKARAKAPNLTGTLEKGIKIKGTKKQKKSTGKSYRSFASVSLDKSADYGVHVELGHRLYMFGRKTLSDIEERPFLRPAADESRKQVADIMVNSINDILKGYGGK